MPKQSHFTCGKCGALQDSREATDASGHAAPVSVYALQCYCDSCNSEARIYGGRYFAAVGPKDVSKLNAADREWLSRKDQDLAGFWPREELPHSYMTHHANFALPKQGYTHWWKMFNSRQLLLLSHLLRASTTGTALSGTQEQVIGAFQQYLRNQNMFCIYDVGYDKLAPFFSNPNYAPKARAIENTSFLTLGRGNLTSIKETVLAGLEWCRKPWDVAPPNCRATSGEPRIALEDCVMPGAEVHCRSSSDLAVFGDKSFDCVITDPPFGDNIFYSDLSNFFYVWMRLPLCKSYPEAFSMEKTPNAQEALAPRVLPAEEANEYYKSRLTACWSEAFRVLKDGGLMAFTFHHSEDSQWGVVLEGLFDAGFILEQTFPIASDEQKGEGGQFGAKGTEYDIIHVCRKRLSTVTEVSWPKMRQWVKAELDRLRRLLESYRANDISDADIRVILRGKALEFYSRHYGQVFTVGGEGEREPLSIRFALGGINQLLDEDAGDDAERPPAIVQPVAYQYLRLFGGRPSMRADDVSKSLFGTAIRQRDFEDHGWVREQNRQVEALPIRDRFENSRRRPRREMKTEIDQAHFLIGGAMPGSGINLEQELTKDTWLVRPTVAAVLDWYGKSAIEKEVRDAAQLAADILRRIREKLREQPEVVDHQKRLFGDLEDEEW